MADRDLALHIPAWDSSSVSNEHIRDARAAPRSHRGSDPISRNVPRNNEDFEHAPRTFEIRDRHQRMLVQVAEDVLALDAEGVMRLVRQLSVANTVRNAAAGEVVVIKGDGITVEVR
jgi:hypothetical protein